jgi:hypothetical protein
LMFVWAKKSFSGNAMTGSKLVVNVSGTVRVVIAGAELGAPSASQSMAVVAGSNRSEQTRDDRGRMCGISRVTLTIQLRPGKTQ